MIRCQRADGHWPVVITAPDSGDEMSTAAFMAYGLRRGVRLGVLDAVDAEQAAAAALAAALRETDAHGILTGVSAAVMACTEASHYAHVPRGFVVPWGQGPLVLALTEVPVQETHDA
jgi:unsaturated rhamnogalacturonyl hydrolase